MLLREIETLEATVMEEVVKRRKLGGYSADAEGILLLAETVLKMIQHMRQLALIQDSAKVDRRKD